MFWSMFLGFFHLNYLLGVTVSLLSLPVQRHYEAKRTYRIVFAELHITQLDPGGLYLIPFVTL